MTPRLRNALILLLALPLVWLTVSHRFPTGPTRVITWDVYGYHLHLPAFLNYGDIRQYTFVEGHIRDYAPSDSPYQITRNDTLVTPTYTLGLALVWLPAYLVADLAARLLPEGKADGMSQPYQAAVAFSGWLAFALGMFALWRFLRRFMQRGTTAVTLLTLGLGTNLFYYSAVEPGMPHVYLFAGYALMLLLTERFADRPTTGGGALLGLVAGLMAVIRPSEALCALLPLLYLPLRFGGLRPFWRSLLDHPFAYALILISGLLPVLPQVLLWKATTGHWIFNSYATAGHSFDLASPHLWDGLFSFRKGWLLYTPLAALGIIGLALLRGRAGRWAPALAIFFVANLWIVLSWHIWWYAGSFGQRALVPSYAILALPLGVLLDRCAQRRWLRDSVLAIILLGIGLNLFQTWQIQRGILKQDGMNAAYYRAAFGRIIPDKSLHRLLDIPETPPEPPLSRENLASLSAHESAVPVQWEGPHPGWKVQGTDAFSPTIDLTLSDSLANALAGRWVSVSTQVFLRTADAPYTQAARLVFDVQGEGRETFWHGLHLQRVVETGAWWPASYEVRLPDNLKAGDRILAYVWSQTDRDETLVHRVDLELLGF